MVYGVKKFCTKRLADGTLRKYARAQHLRQIYNIGTGRATSIKDVCELCIKAMKNDLTMEIKPARTFDFPVFVYDISKAQTLLKFDPKWNLFAGIEDIPK